MILRLTVDQGCHVGGCDHWSTLWYVEVQADVAPEGNTVVFPARGEVQSEGLVLRFLQASAAFGLLGSQFSLLLIKNRLQFLSRSSLLDRTVQRVLLALEHRARVIHQADGHLSRRLCGKTGVLSLIRPRGQRSLNSQVFLR